MHNSSISSVEIATGIGELLLFGKCAEHYMWVRYVWYGCKVFAFHWFWGPWFDIFFVRFAGLGAPDLEKKICVSLVLGPLILWGFRVSLVLGCLISLKKLCVSLVLVPLIWKKICVSLVLGYRVLKANTPVKGRDPGTFMWICWHCWVGNFAATPKYSQTVEYFFCAYDTTRLGLKCFSLFLLGFTPICLHCSMGNFTSNPRYAPRWVAQRPGAEGLPSQLRYHAKAQVAVVRRIWFSQS